MTKTDTFEKVTDVLANYTDVKPEEMSLSSRLMNDLSLTSFDLICLGTSLEQNFHIKVDDSMLNSLQTIEDVIKVVEG